MKERILFTCGKYVVSLSLSRCGGMTKKRMTSQTSWKLRFKKAEDRTKNIKALFFSATFVAGELEPMAYGGGGGGGGGV